MSNVILVTGGREFDDRELVWSALDFVVGDVIMTIRHGGASGLDTLAGEWAFARGHGVHIMYPDYRRYRAAYAPLARNTAMVQTVPPPVLCVSFPGGNGTRDCTEKARQAGITVLYARRTHDGRCVVAP